MSKRKLAIAAVIADVFENGKLGRAGIEAYIAGRLSQATLNEAMRAGQMLRDKAMREGQPLIATQYRPLAS